ncbi:hypothetical protein METBIDRAFT_79922 [Metschnikowia bicuspidata var. bicuspidata NRRL YB-4993]|uniref:Sodium/calcium exchanger membrane region domain-containing protein n=1 Tax=Metschnikowia bicuspidata var. bicuspidata NRRL YB-4993 TaxID=869754 RepID=A0A1A0H4H3_9ASCO|nr:hypothetical protein METBIDRAFT_79922 [Metschnikowia bicuspidata var. bicuspidata NRRL YB-4993]OBA18941.1 hypothetical protein METBIDRAFT_79922 [Metschnikowia bicuspidata var. bicuspidata NRRL YB-4993]
MLPGQNVTDLSCFQVSEVLAQDQCLFVRENCNSDSYSIGRADYLKFYYCSPLRPGSLAVISGVVFFCFVSLALTASDYLCPNLYSISKFLQLSDNLAGLTLLALGNGSPDVLSTYKALEVEATGLAVSELMGAALFILTVVVGAISWVHPFKVPRFHFIRDVSFYLAISFMCILIFISGSLTYWSSLVLFSTYIIYVAVVLFSHSVLWENLLHTANVIRFRSTYEEEPAPSIVERRLDDFNTDYVPHPSIELLLAHSYQEGEDEVDAFLSSHPHNHCDKRTLIETGAYGINLLLKKLSNHTLHLPGVSSSLTLTNERPLTATASIAIENSTADHENTVSDPKLQVKPHHISVWNLILPSLDPEASLLTKAHYFITFPTNSLLRLTTPNREQAIEYGQSLSCNAFNFSTSALDSVISNTSWDYDYSLDMRIFKLQLVAAPVFVLITCFPNTVFAWFMTFLVLISIYGISIMIPEGDSTLKSFSLRHKFWNYFGSFVGFIASLLWISIFATEIVAILKAMAVIFAIQDDLLGATVFALGNSVGDLVSNLIIAKMGMPAMAFGACFGGPLLSISSLGFSAAIIMCNKNKRSISIEFSDTLKWNCFALIVTLTFLAVSIPLNGWTFDRRVGSILLSIWIASSILTIISGL